ncbi:hypothetical protein yc1106_01185 [Curvularia clavata]|uniref:Uncharacterized protein n=1 Tax=Curvularia clavata TaxID=95742 RepID=A0A9Q9DQ21_CURCL|nr:hypothetical protein yc1106_01185 [Curvularia clavata]
MDALPDATQSPSSRCSTPSTPISPASSTGSSYFNSPSSPNEPQVPFQIIVTFDGKVREMLRIQRDDSSLVEQQPPQRPRRTPRPRYYARNLG